MGRVISYIYQTGGRKLQKKDKIMEKKFIEEKATSILNRIGYNGGALDIFEVAKDLGFTIGNALLPDLDDGFILIDDTKEHIQRITGISTDKVIGVNANRNLQNKLFIIAHELGHYMLHYQNDGTLYAHRENVKGKPIEENDADYFAACLLMPRKYFKEKYDDFKERGLSYDDTITLLEKHFNVSYESAKRRIKEIGYTA